MHHIKSYRSVRLKSTKPYAETDLHACEVAMNEQLPGNEAFTFLFETLIILGICNCNNC